MVISRKSISIVGIAIVLLFALIGIAKIEIDRSLVRKKIALVKTDLNNLHVAIVAYTIDYNLFPVPDIDSDGNKVIPKVLTSIDTDYHGFNGRGGPIGPWYPKLLYDPFNHHGKGLYHYCSTKVNGSYWSDLGFIISSYGPDEINGYGTTSFDLEHYVIDPDKQYPEWLDKESIAPYPLYKSPFTYDPTNGLISGGDIWNRGW